MYNTLSDKTPKAPIVGSAYSAAKEIKHWENANNISQFSDKLGGCWDLKTSMSFDALEARDKWKLTVDLESSLNVQSLKSEGILVTGRDDRTIFLLGDDVVPLKMNTKVFSDRSIEGLKSQFVTWLETTRIKLGDSGFESIKKAIISKWLEKKMLFG